MATKMEAFAKAFERIVSTTSLNRYLAAQLDNLRVVAGQAGEHELARDLASALAKFERRMQS